MPVEEPGRDKRPAASARRAKRALADAGRLASEGATACAIEKVRAALDAGAERHECHLWLSLLYRTAGSLEAAVCAAELALEDDPASTAAHEALVGLHLEMRNYPRAVEVVKSLLLLDPRHITARDALGTAYIAMGNVQAAMRVANDQVRLNPCDPGQRFKRALLCEHEGAVRMAIEEFERVLEMSKDAAMLSGARKQLELLDTYQLDQIIALMEVDGGFRIKLMQSCDEALAERGFYLSDSGRLTLQDGLRRGLTEALDDPPRMYH